ncbi:hypothetical protein [Allocatelliglobosispora scoriae]
MSKTFSWLEVVETRSWLKPLLQSHSAGRMPLVWLAAQGRTS